MYLFDLKERRSSQLEVDALVLVFTFILVLSFVSLQEISYDSPRGGVSVITEKGDITTSYLLIQRARSTDTGEYKCIPSNAHPKTVHVHILKGSYLTAHFSTLDLFF
jgi:hypothetical protein